MHRVLGRASIERIRLTVQPATQLDSDIVVCELVTSERGVQFGDRMLEAIHISAGVLT